MLTTYRKPVMDMAREVVLGGRLMEELIYTMWASEEFSLGELELKERPVLGGLLELGEDLWRAVEKNYEANALMLVEDAQSQIDYERSYELKLNYGRDLEYDGEE